MARNNWRSRIASWNAGDVDYWATGRQMPQPGDATGGASDWGKTLGTIVLVILAVPVIAIVIGFVACLVMLALSG